jgi:type IV pilus assembly protein PilW
MSVNQHQKYQSGFTLIEIMIGLVIGLIGTLVIMQTFSLFEGQKRTTTGNADAQVNGSIAIYNIQRHVQSAGFGLPIFDATVGRNDNPLNCNPSIINYDADNALSTSDLFPVVITDGGAGPDSITVRNFPGSDGLPVNVLSASVVGVNATITVDNNVGCAEDDLALIVKGTSCLAAKINPITGPTVVNLTFSDATDASTLSAGPNPSDYARMTCLGPNNSMNRLNFSINNNQLENNGSPVISDIVDLQAQYGVADNAADSNVTSWVDATGGTWAVPSIANRNRIRAVRIAVLARNGLLEKTDVTAALPPTWVPLLGSAAPNFSVAGADWKQYRYRAYETIVPLRNIAWNREGL